MTNLTESTIDVVHYMRKPGLRAYSVERVYGDIRKHVPSDIAIRTCVSRFASRGIFGRVLDIFRVPWCQGDVNHVTGDVHFLTYLLRKHRTVLTILDCVTLERLQGFKKYLFWLLWYWLPEKRCTRVVAISESTKRQLMYYLKCDENKIRVIHCNVSDVFKPAPKFFNQTCPRILQIGTTPNKNIERVAEALRGVVCNFVVVGLLSDEQTGALQKCRISYENYARIADDELIRQYGLCDMLIFASTYEGFGLPIVEANAVGRPVVTSDCWSMPEVAGNAACLVNPLDVQSIRAGVMRVITDAAYRDQLVAHGFENVKRFRVEAVAEKYAELYRDVYSLNFSKNTLLS